MATTYRDAPKEVLDLAKKIMAKQHLELVQADVTMLIDGDHWEEWSEKERTALLDHELVHLALKKNAGGSLTMKGEPMKNFILETAPNEINRLRQINADLIHQLESLLSMPAVCNRDAEAIENVRRRDAARIILNEAKESRP